MAAHSFEPKSYIKSKEGAVSLNSSAPLSPSYCSFDFPSLQHGKLWQLPRCSATQWICGKSSLGLTTQTCHPYLSSNPKLPINSSAQSHLPVGTVTCPPSVCCVPHSTNPLSSQPCSILYTVKMPHDIQMLRDILPHLRLSVCQTPELYRKDKVNLSVLVPGGAQCGCNNNLSSEG